MKATDDELIRQLRGELDELVSGANLTPGALPEPDPSYGSSGPGHDRRWVAIGIAAASVAALVGGLVVLADRDTDDASSETPPATSPPTVPTANDPGSAADRSMLPGLRLAPPGE